MSVEDERDTLPPIPLPPAMPRRVLAPPPPPPEPEGGWGSWGNHVLAELERGSTEREKLGEKLEEHRVISDKHHTEVKVEIASLKVRSSLWGGLSGLAAGIIAALAQFFGLGHH